MFTVPSDSELSPAPALQHTAAVWHSDNSPGPPSLPACAMCQQRDYLSYSVSLSFCFTVYSFLFLLVCFHMTVDKRYPIVPCKTVLT